VRELRVVARRLETTFAGRSLRRFVALQGLDRAVVLSSQAFTALIPLLLLVTALAPADRSDVVAGAITRRFHLRGEPAHAVTQLFAHSANGTTGVLSVVLLLFSGISLARRLQRMYQQAWELTAPSGVGRAVNAALGLAVLVAGIGVLYGARTLVHSLPAGDVLVAPVSVLASLLVWTCVPWLLLDRRIAWRRLVLGGALTAACTTAYGAASTIYMPRLFESYSERYGLFGVTLALIGWLLSIALIVVATTAVAAEFDRLEEPWARRIPGKMRSEPPPGPIDPLLVRQPSVPVEPAVRPGAPPQHGATAPHRSP
jgi:membrane protein